VRVSKRGIVVGLWAIAVGIALAVVLATGGLFGKSAPKQTPMARYIGSINGVQQEMQGQLGLLRTAYLTFSTQGSDPAQAAQLLAVQRTLHTFGTRVAVLPAPPAATRLRLLVLRFVRAEEGVAAELVTLGSFMPRFRDVIGGTNDANAALSGALKAAVPPVAHAVRGTPKQIAAAKKAYAAAVSRAALAQAAAIAAYDAALAVALARLKALQPPAVMAPQYEAEVATLSATRRAGKALSAELQRQNRPNLLELARRFTDASRLSGSLAAQRAEIAAVKAYDARVRAVATAELRVRREVARLQRISA
jgi:hypothetical protein